MSEVKAIIEFHKTMIADIAKLDDAIDKVLAPLKDYTDTISDLATPVKAFSNIYSLRKKMAFKSFLKNYSNQVSSNSKISPDDTAKLTKFLSKDKNLSLVSEVIENAINSRSIKCTAILGVIAGKIMQTKNDVTYNLLCLIDTLKIMTDFDLENFIALYEYLQTASTAHKDTEEYRTDDFYSDSVKPSIAIEKDSLDLTVEKLKRTNALTYNSGGIGQGGNAKGIFETNIITKELYSLINTTQIIY